MRKRIFILILTCVVTCTCVFVQANATYDPTKPIDYTELDYSVKYGIEYNQVSVSIPSEYYYHNVYVGDNSIQQIGGDTFVFTLSPGQTVGLYEYPAGYRGLSLDNIPVGSKLVFDFYLCISAPVDPSWTPRFYQRYHYADLRGNWLGDPIRTEISGSLSQSYTIEYTVESVENAYAFVPSIAINNWGTYSMSDLIATVVMEDVRLVMDISADYWSKWQAGQNGKMLGEIKDTLDDQWNADIEGTPPEGSDVLDNADKVESEIRDDAQAGLDKGAEIQQEAGNILKSDNIAQALLCSVKIFEIFANIPFFANLLVVSVSLGIFALLVNLANSFASWHRGNVREAQREQRRQEASERYSRKHR